MRPHGKSSLTCTVVHAPGALPEGHWRLLRRAAAGRHLHELRLSINGSAAPSGAEISQALLRWIQDVLASEQDCSARPDASTPPSWSMFLAGRPLEHHLAGASTIHPGMVVTLRPARRGESPPPSDPSVLRLCVSSGPDAGRLILLSRGSHTVGRGSRHRGKADIRINDPRLQRAHGTIQVGATQVTLHLPGGRARALSTDASVEMGSSRLELIHGVPPSPTTASWPLVPGRIDERPPENRHRTMLLMCLVPLVVGIVLVIVTGMWMFLVFTAASALVALITVIGAARRRRRYVRAVRGAANDWAARRGEVFCGPGRAIQLLRTQVHPSAPVEHSENRGAPVVTFGEGLMGAELAGSLHAESASPTEEAEVRTVAAASLRAGEITRCTGTVRETRALLRWILVQLAQRHEPAPLVVVVEDEEADTNEDRLYADELRDYRQVCSAVTRDLPPHARAWLPTQAGDADVAPVLLSAARLPEEQLRAASEAGWHVVTGAGASVSDAVPSPGWEIDLEKHEVRRNHEGHRTICVRDLRFDGVSLQTAGEHLRLGLSRTAVHRHAPGTPVVSSAGLPAPLMTHQSSTSLATVLGHGASGEELLDMVHDGPHILLAGTSGAGKSELLKALLLGWAGRYGPEELNFFLFDFKGGAAFQQIARLEHSLGLVTDLSQEQAERALEGVRSELKRREHLFLEAEASDYADYRRRRPDQALARILVVIDEFRIFSHELPHAMDELLRLATLGRSLGLHLILSTQRPQGVVTADIRANIGTIISLRLRSEEESRDLVGTTEAGTIPRQLPGRGIIRCPGEAPRTFQGTQLRAAAPELTALPEGEALEAPGDGSHGSIAQEEDAAPALVSVLKAHCTRHHRLRPHTPLLPPLPTMLSAPLGDEDVLLALVDEPARQMQRPLHLPLAQGQSLALVGEPESGGPHALRAVTRQLLEHPHEVHLYLFDGDHSLHEFRDHPRVGAWVTDEHAAEVSHLLTRLTAELLRRRSGRCGTYVPLVLVMSGHPQWHMMSQHLSAAPWEHSLGTLISDGAGCGVSAVLSGGRELANGRLGSRVARRIYLPYGVPEDTRHLWPRLRAADPLPGRGVLVEPDANPPGHTVQIVTDVAHPESRTGLRPSTSPLDEGMIRVQVLPEVVRMPKPPSFLPTDSPRGDPANTSTQHRGLSLGLTQFNHGQASLPLDQSWQVGLILGVPGTGRTNALEVIAAQCCRARRMNPALEPPHVAVTGGGEGALLLVDDADRCRQLHHRWIEAWLNAGGKVLATAGPSSSIFTNLPWAHRARGGSANFVLSPTSRAHGDPFGLLIPVFTTPIPGRAVWLQPEGPQVLQWWLR